MITMTSLVFINVFQTEHFWAVKFIMSMTKNNMSFLVISEFSKVENIALDLFNFQPSNII